MSMPRYLVTGANGQLGQLAIAELARRVHPEAVVAMVRDPAATSFPAGVDVRQGDYDRPETLDLAFAGIDRLLLISSSAVGGRVSQHRNVIKAAKRAGVSRIAYIGLAGFRGRHIEMVPWRDMRAIGATAALDRLLGDVECRDPHRIGDLGKHPAHRAKVAALMGGDRNGGHPLGRYDGKIDRMTGLARKGREEFALGAAIALAERMNAVDGGKRGHRLVGEFVARKPRQEIVGLEVGKQHIEASVDLWPTSKTLAAGLLHRRHRCRRAVLEGERLMSKMACPFVDILEKMVMDGAQMRDIEGLGRSQTFSQFDQANCERRMLLQLQPTLFFKMAPSSRVKAMSGDPLSRQSQGSP